MIKNHALSALAIISLEAKVFFIKGERVQIKFSISLMRLAQASSIQSGLGFERPWY